MIDDEKFKRIRDVIKLYGLLNEKPASDNLGGEFAGQLGPLTKVSKVFDSTTM